MSHPSHLAAMALYERRRVPLDLWDRLRQDFEADYSRGLLSDNEHDDLFNTWLLKTARKVVDSRRDRPGDRGFVGGKGSAKGGRP